jgi:hypothetical protein
MGLFNYVINSITRVREAWPFKPSITGFEDPKNTGVSYDYTTRKFTFSHASGTVAIWLVGKRYTFASPYTFATAHTDATGEYYLSLRSGGTPAWDTALWDMETMTPMGFAHHDKVNGVYFGLRECHGDQPWTAHLEFHEKVGTYRRSGGLLTAGTFAVSTGGDTDANVTPGTDQVVIADEDLESTLAAVTQGSYTRLHFIAGAPVFTLASAFPFPYTGTTMQYNPTGTSLAVMTNNTYVNVWVIYMPVTSDAESQKYRALWMAGQTLNTSLATAQAEDFRSSRLGTFADIAPEFIPFVQIPYRFNTGYGGTARVRIEATPSYLTGSRSSFVSISGLTSSTHNNMGGRTDPDCHPAAAITVAATTGRVATDLQSYIDARYPGFTDFKETVAGSAKTTFTLTGFTLDATYAVDVEIDGRDQPIEGTQWTRVNDNPGQIVMSENINIGSTFKCRIYSK